MRKVNCSILDVFKNRLEKLTLIFLYNFHREHGLIKLIRKKLSPKINVKKNKKSSLVMY